MNADPDTLVRELEQAAASLRDGRVEGEEAAAVVERCAELAAQIATELDRRAREAHDQSRSEPPDDQERLL